mmetsp:Transcript_29412/g.56471  ORF Transcript_29412/g.56471 Transcript_29412/m.56471 type:complete len:275 (+) Transcript_29412:369-1193(+)
MHNPASKKASSHVDHALGGGLGSREFHKDAHSLLCGPAWHRHFKDHYSDHLSILGALFGHFVLQVFIHLSRSHHVPQKKHFGGCATDSTSNLWLLVRLGVHARAVQQGLVGALAGVHYHRRSVVRFLGHQRGAHALIVAPQALAFAPAHLLHHSLRRCQPARRRPIVVVLLLSLGGSGSARLARRRYGCAPPTAPSAFAIAVAATSPAQLPAAKVRLLPTHVGGVRCSLGLRPGLRLCEFQLVLPLPPYTLFLHFPLLDKTFAFLAECLIVVRA